MEDMHLFCTIDNQMWKLEPYLRMLRYPGQDLIVHVHLEALHLEAPIAYPIPATLSCRNATYRRLVQAVHTRLIPSVIPTSLVSNSYRPTAVAKVAIRRVHISDVRVLGTRFFGK